MLRTRNDQPSLWESVLPEICLRLPAELERVDVWLDDERFFVRAGAHLPATRDPRYQAPAPRTGGGLRRIFGVPR